MDFLRKAFSLFLICCFVNATSAFALPTGAQVENGTVTFSNPAANILDINASDQAIINWQNFNIGADEVVNFIQPSATSMALNNIFGGVTDIEGVLNANGGLIFVNPAGINFGPTANINVGSFIASSLNISSEDFLARRYHFACTDGTVGMIINQGKIVAVSNGFLLLLGGAVANTGTMTAQLGNITMASGNKATVTVTDNQLLSVVVDEATKKQISGVKDAVKNTGTITANGGTVQLTAQTLSDVFDNAINQEGIINATSVGEENGKVILSGGDQGIVRVSGTIDVSGKNVDETGGEVLINGKDVGLFDQATINASGDSGGGQIRIGKDARDLNSLEADVTYIAPDVVLNASAINSGNGGTIETSGKYLKELSSSLFIQGAIGAKAGTWLLDPLDLTISSNPDNNVSGSNPFEPTGASSELNVTTLIDALNSGDVVVQTTGTVGAGSGDITVNSAINSASTHMLTLDAAGAVNFNADLNLNGDLNITAVDNINQAGGAVSVAGLTTLSTSGDILLNTEDNNDFNAVTVSSAHDVYFKDENDLTLNTSTVSGLFNVNAGGVLTQNGALVTTSALSGAGASVSLSGTKVIQNGSITTNGSDILLNGDHGVTQNGTLHSGDTTGAANGVELYSFYGDVHQNGQISTAGSIVDLEAHGDVFESTDASIVTAGDVTTIANNVYLDGTANNFTGVVSFRSHGNPMGVRMTNMGYTTQDLSTLFTFDNSLSGFTLNLPNYDPNAGADTSLSAFINSSVLPNVSSSPTFDLSLVLPSYTSALQIGDDTSGASTNLIDLTQLTSSTSDVIHNLTAKTSGDVSLVLNNGASTLLSANQVDLESTGGDVSVMTQQQNNVIEINGGLTFQTATNGQSITVEGYDDTSEIQTPVLNTTTNRGLISLNYLYGVEGNSGIALNMTENGNAMPNLTTNNFDLLNSFTLTAPNFNGSATALDNFINNNVIHNAKSPANFDLSLILASDATQINIGNGIGGSHVDLGNLNEYIHNLTLRSAGDINFRQNDGSTFVANAIDLESTGGNISIAAETGSDRIAVNSSLTLKTTELGSALDVNPFGSGNIDTPVLNIEGNDSAITLTNVSPNSSFALNMTEDSATDLSTISTTNIGKFDSFSLTATNYAPAGGVTDLAALLNDQILTNVAKASMFDLTLNLPSFSSSLSLGDSQSAGAGFISLIPLSDTIHNLTVHTDGNIDLSLDTASGMTLSAHAVDLEATGPSDVQVLSTGANDEINIASSLTLATGSGGELAVEGSSDGRIEVPVINTTTDGSPISLQNLDIVVGSTLTLNMTENSNAMPDLIYGSEVGQLNSFSLTAPNFDDTPGALENFINNDILTSAASPSTFDLMLNLPSYTSAITVGDASGTYIDLNNSNLQDTIHNLTVHSAGRIDLVSSNGNTVTTNRVDLLTTGSGSALLVNTFDDSSDSIVLNTLNTTTNGGSVTVNNNSATPFAFNMTENSNAVPNLIIGGTGTFPTFSSFSLTAPNLNLTPGNLENFVNSIFDFAVSSYAFDLSLDLSSYASDIEVGDDTSGTYINLSTAPLNNTIGDLTIKSAGTINFTNNGGGTITANSLDLETTGLAGAVNIEAVNSGDTINVNSAITAKATGTSGSIVTGNGAGQINTTVFNTETNGGSIGANGITENFTMNITEDSDNTPDLLASLQMSFTDLNVTAPNYNWGNDTAGNISLTAWFNFIFSSVGVTGGINLAAIVAANPHSIQMGYGANGDFIDLSQLNGGTYTGAAFGDLVIKSAGSIDFVASADDVVANSLDLETTGDLAHNTLRTAFGHTITLTSSSSPLTMVASGGGDIDADSGNSLTVSAAKVAVTSAGGDINLYGVTGGAAGTSAAYTLNMTDNSGLVPTLQTGEQLNSFSFTAPNLIWEPDNSFLNLVNAVFANETTVSPSTFDMTWQTTGLRDTIDWNGHTFPGATIGNLTLNTFGTFDVEDTTISGNMNLTSSNADILSINNGIVVSGTTTITADNDITLTSPGDDFGHQSVTLSGNVVQIDDANTIGLLLGSVTSNGNFTASARAGLTVGGSITSGGTVSLDADTVSSHVGILTVSAGIDAGHNTVTLLNSSSAISGGDAITLSASVTAGDLNLGVSSGGITQSGGSISSTGITTLENNGTTIEDIILNRTNIFATVAGSGNLANVTLKEFNSLILGDMTAESLTVTTGTGGAHINGALTQSGALHLSGPSSFTVQSSSSTPGVTDITLSNAGNDFGDQAVTLRGTNITLNDTNGTGLTLGNVTASGDVAITAQKDITQNVSTTISSADADTANTGIDITSSHGNIIQNGDVTTAGSKISMTADGDFTQNGTITAGSGFTWGDVTLSADGGSGGSTGILTQTGTIEGNDLTLSASVFNSTTGALLQNGTLISHDSNNSNNGIQIYEGQGYELTQGSTGTMSTDGSNIFLTNNSAIPGQSMTLAGSINTNGGDVVLLLNTTGTITQNGTGSIAANQVALFLTNDTTVVLDSANNNFRSVAVDNYSNTTTPISTALTVSDQGNLAYGLFYSSGAPTPVPQDSFSSLILSTTGSISELTSNDDGDIWEPLPSTGPTSIELNEDIIKTIQSVNGNTAAEQNFLLDLLRTTPPNNGLLEISGLPDFSLKILNSGVFRSEIENNQNSVDQLFAQFLQALPK